MVFHLNCSTASHSQLIYLLQETIEIRTCVGGMYSGNDIDFICDRLGV